jgi:hypothetical protein
VEMLCKHSTPPVNRYDSSGASLFTLLIRESLENTDRELQLLEALDFLCGATGLGFDMNASDKSGISPIECAASLNAKKAILTLFKHKPVVSFLCVRLAAHKINDFNLFQSIYKKYLPHKKDGAQPTDTNLERQILIADIFQAEKKEWARFLLTTTETALFDNLADIDLEVLYQHWDSENTNQQGDSAETHTTSITETLKKHSGCMTALQFMIEEKGMSSEEARAMIAQTRNKPVGTGRDDAEEKEAEKTQLHTWFRGAVDNGQATIKMIENSNPHSPYFLLLSELSDDAQRLITMSRWQFDDEHGTKPLAGDHPVSAQILYKGGKAHKETSFTHEIKPKGIRGRILCISIPSDNQDATLLIGCYYLRNGLHHHKVPLPRQINVNLDDAPAAGLSPLRVSAAAASSMGLLSAPRCAAATHHEHPASSRAAADEDEVDNSKLSLKTASTPKS